MMWSSSQPPRVYQRVARKLRAMDHCDALELSRRAGVQSTMGMNIGGQGQKAEINVTPMIDVLLVLIIIFMVITPTVSIGLPTLVPQPSDESLRRAAPPPVT